MPVLGVALLVATAFSGEACLTDACKESHSEWGKAPDQGSLVDPNTWQSTPIDGEWVPFPHQVRLEFFHSLGRAPYEGRIPYEVLVWVSAEKKPLAGSNFTLAGGDTATVYKVLYDVVSLTNNTCADYFVRIVVRAAPAPPPPADAGNGDGAPEPDGGTVEGGAADGGPG